MRSQAPAVEARAPREPGTRIALTIALLVAASVVVASLIDGWRQNPRLGIVAAVLLIALPVLIAMRSPRPEVRRGIGRYPVVLDVLLSCAAIVSTSIEQTAGILLAAAAATIALLPVFPRARLDALAIATLLPILVEIALDVADVRALVHVGLVIAVGVLVWLRRGNSIEMLVVLWLSCSAIVLASVALYVIGVRADYIESFTLAELSSPGFFGPRWRLPLSTGWSQIPMLAVLACAFATGVLRSPGGGRGWIVLRVAVVASIAVNAIAIIGSGGRAAMVAAVAVLVAGLLPLARAVRIGVGAAMQALWLIPAWWTAFVSDDATAEFVSRLLPIRSENTLSAITLEGRTTIWDLAFQVLFGSRADAQLLGWGPDGHVPSGASAAYGYILSGSTTNAAHSPHNAWLELLFSSGFLGTALVLACALVAGIGVLRHVSGRGASGAVALAIAVGLPAIAATDVGVLPSNLNPVTAVIPVAVLVAALPTTTAPSSRELDRVHGALRATHRAPQLSARP